MATQTTSTLYGPHLTSELVGFHDHVGDYMCEFPLAWWTMRFLEEVRVFEIHGPADWHDLCVRYPAKGTEDDRLVPNWGAAAEEWDGVHLSIGRSAYRRAESVRVRRRVVYAGLLARRADLIGYAHSRLKPSASPTSTKGWGRRMIENLRSHRHWARGGGTLLISR